MTKETTAESQTTERLTREQFLYRLYDMIVDWAKEGAEVVHEFQPQTIKGWDYHSANPGPGVYLDLALEKGIVLKTD